MLRQTFAATLLISAFFAILQSANAQQASATDNVRAIAQQYFEAWYSANGKQMEQIVHPMLAKRGPIIRKEKDIELSDMSALRLVQATEQGGGSTAPDSLVNREIHVLSVNSDIASVKIDSELLTEYLHLIKWEGEWKIINILWEIKPKWREEWNYS
jgi:hypothetical protein